MAQRLTAHEFYNRIKDKRKYKLVNGLFIVKSKGNGIYSYVGDFHKKGTYGASSSTSYVEIKPSKQLFNPKKKLATTTLGYWQKLNISFNTKPISYILKD